MKANPGSGFTLAWTCWLLAAPSIAGQVVNEYSVDPAQAVDPVTGIRVPVGFAATVFADVEGYGRHMAMRAGRARNDSDAHRQSVDHGQRGRVDRLHADGWIRSGNPDGAVRLP